MNDHRSNSSGCSVTALLRGHILLAACLTLIPLHVLADPPVIYHSPNDDGVPAPGPVGIAPNSPATLHLYIDGGVTPSASGVCATGTGDEICGYDLDINGTGGLSLSTFTPVTGVEYHLTSTTLGIVGGDPWRATLGPVKIGDLDVQGPDAAAIELMPSQAVSASLSTDSIPQATIATVSNGN
jgi:hypothetical protein